MIKTFQIYHQNEGCEIELQEQVISATLSEWHISVSFVTPTVLQSGGGGDRSCSFIAVEERTRKMLTAFMRCGINNNRLGFIAFYSAQSFLN